MTTNSQDDLIPTLMLLFDGKSREVVCDTILAYLSGNNRALLYLQRKLDEATMCVPVLTYSVSELYDDISERNNDAYDMEPMEIVCSDQIALKCIEEIRDYRRMEYAYDTFQEVKTLMIDEMISMGYIVPSSHIQFINDNPYWGG